MRTLAAAATTAVAGLALTGCSGGTDTAATGPATVTVTVTSTVTATPSPTTTAAPEDDRLPLGKTADFAGEVTVTVQRVISKVPGVADYQSGPQLAGALVRSCVKKVPDGQDWVAFSWEPWSVVEKDSSTFPATGTISGAYPGPMYPLGEEDGQFKAGQCTKGWIYFDVNKGTKVTEVRYSSQRGNSQAWVVK